MPFSPTGSIVSTDLDNMLRGLYRDNSDSVLTGTIAETTLKSVSIAANTLSAIGGFHLIIAGTLAGAAGAKTIRLKLGATTIATITDGAATVTDWFFDVWCYNTASGAQRWSVQRVTNDLLTSSYDYTTSAEDTTANKTLAVTGQLGNVADTITATLFYLHVIQKT